MSGSILSGFLIGKDGWPLKIRSLTDQFDKHYWDNFRPCNTDEIIECEHRIKRKFPFDFREFLLRVGAGHFGEQKGNGVIYTPEAIVLACSGPLRAVLGSSKWATREEHLRFYASRGAYNPCPTKFTEEALVHDGVNLLDLVQIGSDGGGNYHQLNVAEPTRPFSYCLLADGSSIEDRLPCFSDGLKLFLTREWQSSMGLDNTELELEEDFLIDYE